MSKSKLTDEQRVEIAELHVLGKTHAELAEQFGVSPTTIQKTTSRINVGRPTKPTQGLRSMPAAALTEFSKRAKSILWRQDGGKVKKNYDRWKRLVEELKTDGGCTREQAIIQASKDFPCLKRLFRDCRRATARFHCQVETAQFLHRRLEIITDHHLVVDGDRIASGVVGAFASILVFFLFHTPQRQRKSNSQHRK